MYVISVVTIHKEIDDRLHWFKCLRPNVVSLANLNLSGSAMHIYKMHNQIKSLFIPHATNTFETYDKKCYRFI